MMLLDGDTLSLDDLVAIADAKAPVGLSARARTRVAASRAVVDAAANGDRPVYGVNTGFGSFAETRIRSGSALAPATESAAQPCRRRRCTAAGTRGARVDGAAGQRAGQGLLGNPPRDARGAHRPARPRRAPPRAEPRIRRRQRRSRAARAHRARARRGGRDVGRFDAHARRRCARRRRPGAHGAGGEGRARAHQRHPGVDGRARAGTRRGRAARTRRGYRGRHVDRRAARIATSVRRAHPRWRGRSRGRPPRPTTSTGSSRAARSTRHTPIADACRTPTRCGARRRCTAPRAKRCSWARQMVDRRDERRHRQSDGVRGDGRDRVRRQLSRRARRHRGRLRWCSRSRSSRPSASAARNGSSIRR